MEGLIIWIVIIVGWAVIKGLSGPSEEEQIEAKENYSIKLNFRYK